MSFEEPGIVDRARALREAFDRSFAEPPGRDGGGFESVLEVGIGEARYAIRMSEIGGLFPDRTTAPLPTAVAELVGIAGFRGSLLPVYDLARLLGVSTEEPSRWLLVVAGGRVALACPQFIGYFRAPPGAIVARDRATRTDGHVGEDVVAGDRVMPLISLESIMDVIGRRASHSSPRQER